MVAIFVILAPRSGSSLDWATQIGTRASTTATDDRSSASCSADLLVYQPPWLKPTTTVATAPSAAPVRPGFSPAGIFMIVSWDREGRSRPFEGGMMRLID